MKISQKVIDTVIKETVGEDALPLVQALKNRKNVSEFKLTENINRQINETRNMLYRLYHQNLVSFTRKKDKKKGWYIYYWTFNAKRIKFLLKSLKTTRIEHLQERLGREKGHDFYTCNSSCMRLEFDQAINFNYKCPECGELMDLQNNHKMIQRISSEITSLKKELKNIK